MDLAAGGAHVGAGAVVGAMGALCPVCRERGKNGLRACLSAQDPDTELIAFFSVPFGHAHLNTQSEMKQLLTRVKSHEVVAAARWSDVAAYLVAPNDREMAEKDAATALGKARWGGTRTYNPRWLQFSGHARLGGRLVFEPDVKAGPQHGGEAAREVAPSPEAFAEILGHCPRLEGVFLNACHTGMLARHVNACLPEVACVGWEDSVLDLESFAFAKQLFEALGAQFGRPFEEAFAAAMVGYVAFWKRPANTGSLRKAAAAADPPRSGEPRMPLLMPRRSRDSQAYQAAARQAYLTATEHVRRAAAGDRPKAEEEKDDDGALAKAQVKAACADPLVSTPPPPPPSSSSVRSLIPASPFAPPATPPATRPPASLLPVPLDLTLGSALGSAAFAWETAPHKAVVWARALPTHTRPLAAGQLAAGLAPTAAANSAPSGVEAPTSGGGATEPAGAASGRSSGDSSGGATTTTRSSSSSNNSGSGGGGVTNGRSGSASGGAVTVTGPAAARPSYLTMLLRKG